MRSGKMGTALPEQKIISIKGVVISVKGKINSPNRQQKVEEKLKGAGIYKNEKKASSHKTN